MTLWKPESFWESKGAITAYIWSRGDDWIFQICCPFCAHGWYYCSSTRWVLTESRWNNWWDELLQLQCSAQIGVVGVKRCCPYRPTSWDLGLLRDGPLEKLWGGGGRGIFELQEFFFVIKFLVWIFFRPLHEYFLGLIGVQEFFSFNFPLREFFFCTSPAPPPLFF